MGSSACSSSLYFLNVLGILICPSTSQQNNMVVGLLLSSHHSIKRSQPGQHRPCKPSQLLQASPGWSCAETQTLQELSVEAGRQCWRFRNSFRSVTGASSDGFTDCPGRDIPRFRSLYKVCRALPGASELLRRS